MDLLKLGPSLTPCLLLRDFWVHVAQGESAEKPGVLPTFQMPGTRGPRLTKGAGVWGSTYGLEFVGPEGPCT